MNKKILILGGTGFIGKNLVKYYLKKNYWITATYNNSIPFIKHKNIKWLKTNLCNPHQVKSIFTDKYDLVIQCAATTSGSKDIVNNPSLHVTDNAIMNSLILKYFNQSFSKHIIFFSCTVMLRSNKKPQREIDYKIQIDPINKYFGVAWTKIYIEKIMKFYSNLNLKQKYTVIRHSNIYGPYDKFDLEKGHVLASAIVKVYQSKDKVIMWGDGSEKRDLLYIDDLCNLVNKLYKKQKENYLLINCGLGRSVSILDLYKKIIEISKKNLLIEKDLTKPTIKFDLTLNSEFAKKRYGWSPINDIDKGITKTLNWYKKNYE